MVLQFAILDPTNVGWLNVHEDLHQAFLGWAAFPFSDWQRPLSMSRLVAWTDGCPNRHGQQPVCVDSTEAAFPRIALTVSVSGIVSVGKKAYLT